MGADDTILVIKHRHGGIQDFWIVWHLQAADNFDGVKGYRWLLENLTRAKDDEGKSIEGWATSEAEAFEIAHAAEAELEWETRHGVVLHSGFDQEQYSYVDNNPDETDAILQVDWEELASIICREEGDTDVYIDDFFDHDEVNFWAAKADVREEQQKFAAEKRAAIIEEQERYWRERDAAALAAAAFVPHDVDVSKMDGDSGPYTWSQFRNYYQFDMLVARERWEKGIVVAGSSVEVTDNADDDDNVDEPGAAPVSMSWASIAKPAKL